MSTPKPHLRRIDFDAADAAAIAYAKTNQVPSTTYPSGQALAETGEGASLPQVAPMPKPARAAQSRRIHINLPLYAIKELKDRATKDDTTLRYVVLSALRAAGVKIKDDDMIEDGRRVSA